MEENQKARRQLGFRMYRYRLGTLLAVAAMSGLPVLVSIVLESNRVSLVVRHRSRVSGYLVVDDHGERHNDQSCLGVFDYKGPKAVGKEVDWEELVEGCGRTCWLTLAEKIYVRS